MDQQAALEILRGSRAIITKSHVVLASGRHGEDYVNKDAAYPDEGVILLCEGIARAFVLSGVQIVIGPATGAIVLSQHVAGVLRKLTGQKVLSVYSDKGVVGIPDPEGKGRNCYAETGDFVIKRGYDRLIAGRQVLVVEDVLTTGGSALKTIEAVRAAGGFVVGLGVLCNRGGVTAAQVGNVPVLHALVNVNMESWPEAECPLCAKGVPINTDVGKGREFLARKNK